jgi:hypothetical protein
MPFSIEDLYSKRLCTRVHTWLKIDKRSIAQFAIFQTTTFRFFTERQSRCFATVRTLPVTYRPLYTAEEAAMTIFARPPRLDPYIHLKFTTPERKI